MNLGDTIFSSEVMRKSIRDGKWHKRHMKIVNNMLFIGKDADIKNPEKVFQIDKSLKIVTSVTDGIGKISISSDTMEEQQFAVNSSELLNKWKGILSNVSVGIKPKSMDDFTLVSVLGKGFLGKVTLARLNDTDQLYAIKSIRKEHLLGSTTKEAILNERNILMRISHPFIVKLAFSFQTETKFYFGLEYAAGGELFYHMQTHGQIDVFSAKIYAAEIILALEHLHSLGIVYRDLKPENILFDEEGHIKLTDFGLAKDTSESMPTTFCGTCEYLAPEIIRNEPYSFPVDIWALGVLLYEMLFAVTPFYSENTAELFGWICYRELDLPIGIPEEISDILLRMMEKDASKRITVSELKDHPFFADLDWDAVYRREYLPNYLPDIRPGANVDPEFTAEPAVDSFVANNFGDSAYVPGFSYVENTLVDV